MDVDAVSSYNQEITPELFVELMKAFFDRGWMVGSSGGMAAATADKIYYSPSSVQKERLIPDELFVFGTDEMQLISRPKCPQIKESACVPIFNLLLNEDEKTTCIIHTHSKYSNLLTQLLAPKDVFEINDQEMIKGVLDRQTLQAYSNQHCLQVPIIENATQEYLLLPQIKEVLTKHPNTSAVLVRNHGLFVWGPTWQKTKIMLECYEYLIELACDMIKHDVPLIKPNSVN